MKIVQKSNISSQNQTQHMKINWYSLMSEKVTIIVSNWNQIHEYLNLWENPLELENKIALNIKRVLKQENWRGYKS